MDFAWLGRWHHYGPLNDSEANCGARSFALFGSQGAGEHRRSRGSQRSRPAVAQVPHCCRLARDDKNDMTPIPAPSMDLFSFGRNGGGRGLRGFGQLKAARLWEMLTRVAGLVPCRCACVQSWALQKQVSNYRFGLFNVWKHELSAKMLTFAVKHMVTKRASRTSSIAVHAGRQGSVKQGKRGLWCRPNRMSLRRGRSGTVVKVQTVSTILFFVHAAGSVEFRLSCEGLFVLYYVTAKRNKVVNEYVCGLRRSTTKKSCFFYTLTQFPYRSRSACKTNRCRP